MQDVFRKLELTGDAVDRESAALALSKLGYRLEPCEISRLLEQVDTSNSGKVKRGALAASQIDWRHLQQNHMDTWLDIARCAFAALDRNGDGLLHVSDIMSSLKSKLPQDELRLTIQQAMQEAGHGEDAEAMDFDGFLRMLRVGSVDSLDQYDARWDRTGSFGSSLDRLQSLLDSSQHGSDDSTHGRNSRGLYAGMPQLMPSAAAAAAANSGGVTASAADAYRDKSWQKPMVNFKFDFGNEFRANKMGAGALANQGPPQTQGAPDADAAAAEAAAAAVPEPKPASNAISASSYFNNGAVRGGGHFDKRMHGGSLYRNAVVGGGRPNQLHAAHALPTVRE
jgi:calcium-dependent protein kinase